MRPFADIHRGHVCCDEKVLKRELDRLDDNSLIWGLGDWFDGIVTKDLKRYRKSSDATAGDAILDEARDMLYRDFNKAPGRILGLHSGNHEDTILEKCGTNLVAELARMLSTDRDPVPFFGYHSLTRLVFHDKNTRSRSVIIRTHHGFGGPATTPGAYINRFRNDVAAYDADIYLYGHVHVCKADILPRHVLCGNRVIAYPRYVVLCGTFLNTLTDSPNVVYSDKKGYIPIIPQCPVIYLKPDRDKVKIRVDATTG